MQNNEIKGPPMKDYVTFLGIFVRSSEIFTCAPASNMLCQHYSLQYLQVISNDFPDAESELCLSFRPNDNINQFKPYSQLRILIYSP